MNNEQIFSFSSSRSIRFEDLASCFNLSLVFQTRDVLFKSRRAFIYCYFITSSGKLLYEHDRCIRAYWHGDGNTHLQAIRDYIKQISGKTLIVGPTSLGKGMYYDIPSKLVADSKTLLAMQRL